jgi:hypothetical protein
MATPYFQTIDDKEQCVGIYKDGVLHFDNLPSGCSRTWRYSASLKDKDVEYGWLYAEGQSLEEACPEHLKEDFERCVKKMRAFRKSFELAKIDFHDHCFFDLVPHDFLVKFLEIKNQITAYVFETFEKPANYDFLVKGTKLLQKIKHQRLNLNNKDCKGLFLNYNTRRQAQKILAGAPFIDYKLFGTVTGRLSTDYNSFPILTMKKELRQLIKPQNDWFLSLDYNGAEARTVLALLESKQPSYDIHQWNIENVFNPERDVTREEAKTLFFSWLYNPDSTSLSTEVYDREALLEKFYIDGEIRTPFQRRIKVDERRAFNYLIQSTTSDLVLERAVAIDEFLENKKSFISHIIHDELVLDLCDEERDLVPQLKKLFATNTLTPYMVNVNAGSNYYELEALRI